ncbi:MAG: ABC transporter permease [Clostridia bacterium]|nr:ABC transporter permease [Clostridia bacterium]
MGDIIVYLNSLPPAIAQGIMWGIMAIGVYVTYKILDIADLTVDGSICTGAAVCAVMITNGVPMWLALVCAFVSGMLAGLVTGIMHTFMGIPAILASILTQLMLYSVNLKIMGGSQIALNADKVDLFVTNRLARLSETILILEVVAVVLIALLYWFFGTELGATVRATGANLHMSRAQGINTSFTKIFGLVLSNGIVALAGALLAQYNGSANNNFGKGAIVIGLAAVIIGEALFGWMSRNNFALKLIAVVLGGIVYYIVYSTVIFFKIDTEYLKLLSAVLVALFLAVPYWKKKYFSSVAQMEKHEQKLAEKSRKKAERKTAGKGEA